MIVRYITDRDIAYDGEKIGVQADVDNLVNLPITKRYYDFSGLPHKTSYSNDSVE